MTLVKRRMLLVLSLLCLILVIIAGRFYFQVVRGPELALKAANMRTRGFRFPNPGVVIYWIVTAGL